MTTPVDDYLGFISGEQKTAAPAPATFMKGFTGVFEGGNVGRMIGEAALVGGTAAVLSGAAGKIYGAITKKRDFSDMMKVNPDLQEYQQENPRLFNAHYNSLRSLNPEFASDPVVAGTYMRQMSMSPSTAGKVVAESLGAVPRGPGGAEFMAGGDKPVAMKFKF